jgi:hypothetical protein
MKTKEGTTMSAIDTVNTFLTALQSGDMELAANTMSDDFTMSGFAPKTLNKNQFLVTHSNLLASMPDFSYNLTDELAEADGAVQTEIQITGTQLNPLTLSALGMQTLPETGLAITLAQTPTTFRVNANNQVASMEMQPIVGGGLEGLLQQVGAELPIEQRRGYFNG